MFFLFFSYSQLLQHAYEDNRILSAQDYYTILYYLRSRTTTSGSGIESFFTYKLSTWCVNVFDQTATHNSNFRLQLFKSLPSYFPLQYGLSGQMMIFFLVQLESSHKVKGSYNNVDKITTKLNPRYIAPVMFD